MNQTNVIAVAPGAALCAISTQQFKTSRLLLQLAVPLQLGRPKETAANALLPFILHRSCAAYPKSRALEEKLAELYGAKLVAYVQKQGEAQMLTLALTAIDDRFALQGEAVAQGCADLLLDLLFAPNLEQGLFLEQSVALEKRLLIERLESEEGDKWAYTKNRCDALMCSQEAYGLNPLGEKEAVAALTPQDVTQAWRRVLSTAAMQLTLVSGGSSAAIEKALALRFAGQQRSPVTPQTRFIAAAGEEKFIRETQPVEQAKLMLGFRAGMQHIRDHADALWVMSDLLGGGPYSKLFLNVREKMSLCYAIGAAFVRVKGLLTIRAGVDTEKAPQAQQAILEQVKLLQDGEFTDEELATCVRAMCDSIRTMADTPEDLAYWYSLGLVWGEHPSLEAMCERIAAVTRGDVIAAAQGLTLDTVYLLASANEKEAQP